MCTGKPKTPEVQPIPDRRPSVLPDGGDPSVRLAHRNRRRLMASSMIFTNQGTLGAPSVTAPSMGGG
jgi:hypothetical protein